MNSWNKIGDTPDYSVRQEPAADVVFTVEHIDVARLEQMWTDLERRADINFFLSWGWIGTWIEQAGLPDFVLVGRANDQLVCLGLLRKKVQWRHGFVRSRMLFLNQTGVPDQDVIQIEYNGFLCDRRFAHVGPEAIAAGRRSDVIGSFDEFHIGGVTEGRYEEARHLGWNAHVHSLKGTAFVDLRELRENGEEYLASLSSNTRYQIKRAIKIYESRGPLRLEPARTTEEALAFFDELGVLHQATWERRGSGGGAWRYPFLVEFHRKLISKVFSTGGVDIVKISCGGRPVGYIHCLVHKGWIGSYLSGFAYEEDNKVKPGLVSFYLYIQHKLKTDGELFDFMAGDHRYKTSLGKPGPNLYWFRIQEWRPQLVIEQGLRYVKRKIAAMRAVAPTWLIASMTMIA